MNAVKHHGRVRCARVHNAVLVHVARHAVVARVARAAGRRGSIRGNARVVGAVARAIVAGPVAGVGLVGVPGAGRADPAIVEESGAAHAVGSRGAPDARRSLTPTGACDAGPAVEVLADGTDDAGAAARVARAARRRAGLARENLGPYGVEHHLFRARLAREHGDNARGEHAIVDAEFVYISIVLTFLSTSSPHSDIKIIILCYFWHVYVNKFYIQYAIDINLCRVFCKVPVLILVLKYNSNVCPLCIKSRHLSTMVLIINCIPVTGDQCQLFVVPLLPMCHLKTSLVHPLAVYCGIKYSSMFNLSTGNRFTPECDTDRLVIQSIIQICTIAVQYDTFSTGGCIAGYRFIKIRTCVKFGIACGYCGLRR